MSKLRRLDQLLASLGYGSRREAQALVDRGYVAVKGVIVDRADLRVNAAEVTFKGEPLEAPHGLLAMLHKPLGYVCTHSGDEGPNIYELLPPRWLQRNPAVSGVGRLDKDTSGLLLVTDRGDLIQRWTSPKSDISKVYEVTVDKPMPQGLVEVFAAGTLMLRGETKPCLPAELEEVDETHARIIIQEGRYHQVRRMFASQGLHVTELHRPKFGEFSLDDLPEGQWRLLDAPA